MTGNKIKNGTITGSKIKLSSLGTVPSAQHSATASNASNATNAANLAGLQRYSATISTAGPSSTSPAKVTLGTFGPFSLVGECYLSSGSTVADTFLMTSQSGDAMESYDNSYADPFGPTDGLLSVTYGAISGTSTSPNFQGPYDGSWAAMNNDGTLSVNGFPNEAVYEQGPSGPACSFSGYVISES